MELPNDLIRRIASFCDDMVRKRVCEVFVFQQFPRVVSVSDETFADLDAIQNARELNLEHQNVAKFTLQCEKLSMNQCTLNEVSCPKLRDLFLQGHASVHFHGPVPLEKLFLSGSQRQASWPYRKLKRLYVDTSVQFAENLSVQTEFLELNQAFAPLELSYIQSWSFDELSVDMDPNDLLNHCIARGLQLPNKTFDVSFLRMFQFDQNFFQKMMHVMPNLTRLIARGCNWSPALAKLLEDGLSRQPPIQHLDLDDNFAIETWTLPMKTLSARGLFKNHGSFMFQQFAKWPLESLSIDLSDDCLDSFFEYISSCKLRNLKVYLSKVQTSDRFLRLSEQYAHQIRVPHITFEFSYIQKVSQTWFAQLKKIWSIKPCVQFV